MEDSSYFMNDRREAGRLKSKVDSGAWVSAYLERLLTESDAVLDVGCGPGHLAQYVAGMVSRVVGVDLHSERFDGEHTPANLSFVQADAAALPFDENEFDVTYMRFLLEYLPDKQRAVDELAIVTRPGDVISPDASSAGAQIGRATRYPWVRPSRSIHIRRILADSRRKCM